VLAVSSAGGVVECCTTCCPRRRRSCQIAPGVVADRNRNRVENNVLAPFDEVASATTERWATATTVSPLSFSLSH